MTQILYKEEAYAVIGAAMEVHKQLGFGFSEAIYQEAMQIECELRGIPFEAQKRLVTRYKDRVLQKEYIADIVCFDKIIVELKAIKDVGSIEKGQILNYLKVTGLRLGLLINFGVQSLQWERLIL